MADQFDFFSRIVWAGQRQALQAREEGNGGADGAGGAKPGPSAPSPVFDVSGPFESSSWGWSPPDVPPDFPSDGMVSAAVAAEAVRVREGWADGSTPPTDRGVKVTIHGATITIFAPVDEVADLVAGEYFADFCVITDRGLERFEESGRTKYYGALFRGPNGIFLRADPVNARDHVSVELKGEAFEVYGVVPFARLMAACRDRGYQWNLTRVDAAWDGHDLSPELVRDAFLREDLRTRVRRKSGGFFEDYSEGGGQTFQMGTRETTLMRVYNKRGFNRLELQCGGKRAKWMGLQLVNAPLEKWGEICMGNLRDFVDFVDGSSDKCVTRRKLLPWWAEFVGASERIKVRLSDGLKTLSDCAASVVERLKQQHRRIARQVAVLRKALGAEVLTRWVDEAEKAFEGKHRIRAAELAATVGNYAEIMGEKVEDLLFDRSHRLAL